MLYHTTLLVAKFHPICETTGLSSRMAQWQVMLSEYDIQYFSQKAIKEIVVAESLAERANDDYVPMSFHFPDEDIWQCLMLPKNQTMKMNGLNSIFRRGIECSKAWHWGSTNVAI